jgi:hypothetical protein
MPTLVKGTFMTTRMTQCTAHGLLAVSLVAAAMIAASCSKPPPPASSSDTPTASGPSAPAAPSATAPMSAATLSSVAKFRQQMGTSKPAPAPTKTIAPNDYIGLAKSYAGDIDLAPQPVNISIDAKREIAPTVKLTVTNSSARTVNHLVIHGTLKAGTAYSDEVRLTPVAATAAAKSLAKNKGQLVVDVQFKRKALTKEDLAVLEKAEAIYQFDVVELGFAD